MRIKNHTGFLAACRLVVLGAPVRLPDAAARAGAPAEGVGPGRALSVVVRGDFDLRRGGPAVAFGLERQLDYAMLSGDVFASEEEPLAPLLRPDDFAPYKPAADLLLSGVCHPPGTEPVAACEVGFELEGAAGGPAAPPPAKFGKRLWVVGDREWRHGLGGAVPGEAQPFRSMPLDWSRAFGAAGYPDNPAGKGFGGRSAPPNVELAGKLVSSPSDRAQPAGFGPISPRWAERAALLEKATRKAKSGSGFPAALDPSYFCAAPADQRLAGYLRGDESLVLTHLVGGVARFEAALPGVRVRAFTRDPDGHPLEVALVLDTLFVDAEAQSATLVWRGLAATSARDLDELGALLVTRERLASEAPRATYFAELEAFERDPVGESLPPDEGGEPGVRAAWGALRQERPPPADAEGLARDVEGRLFMLEPKRRARVAQTVRENARRKGGDTHVGDAMGGALTQAAAKGAAAPPAPSGTADARAMAAVGALVTSLRELGRHAAAHGQKLEGMDRLEEALRHPRMRDLDPAARGPEPAGGEGAPAVEPGPGADLRGRDLSERDLRGMDLSGADLRGANLTRAKLGRAKLVKAELGRAVLYQAELEDADLTEADLGHAVLVGARACRARLSRARLGGAVLDDIDLSDALLDGAFGSEPVLMSRADLRRVKARGLALERAVATKVKLEGADLRKSTLVRCCFMEAAAEGADFGSATLTGSTFHAGALDGARLGQVVAPGSVWLDAKLAGADLSLADLAGAHLRGVAAEGACFYGANLRAASFGRADLRATDFERANLHSADLTRSRLDGARLCDANLYRASFDEATLAGCDLAGANLTQSSLERLS